jgi:hypothetical protein
LACIHRAPFHKKEQHMNGRQNQSQSQSQSQGTKPAPPGEDPGTLTDEDYLEAGGPDALDSADEDPHPDSPVSSRRDQVEDPERSGGAEDHSNLM